LVRDKVEVLRREEARAILGIPSDATAIYISTGGGGDVAAETFFAQLPELARRMPETYFVVGAGALYRGREFLAPNLLWTRRYGMMELFAAFDAALTAGGFNSVCELLHVGVPCVFLPQPRSHDNQEERVQRCASAGAGIVLTETTPAAIQTSLQAVLSEREQFATAAATLVPRNHATDAAAAILALHLPAERVERAVELLLPERLAPYALWEKHFLRLVGWVATQDVDDVWEHAETLWQSLRAEGIPIEKIPTIARQQSA
jgi:UDP:flavonoid glycosyltransferase YjiC (YdhE family)